MPARKKTTVSTRSATRRPPRTVAIAEDSLNFRALIEAIRRVDEHCAAQANRVVNVTLTLRNWTIGACIHHYAWNGADRAEYGEGLLDALSERLTELRVSNCNRRQLYRYLRFWRVDPGIVGTLPP